MRKRERRREEGVGRKRAKRGGKKKTKMKEKKKMERHTHGRKGINLIKAFKKYINSFTLNVAHICVI